MTLAWNRRGWRRWVGVWAWVVLAWGLGAGMAGAQVKWTTRTSNVSAPLQDVTFGNGTFVAVAGDGSLAVSTDNGTKWTHVGPGLTTNLTCVAYGDGKFTAMGVNGAVMTSKNGMAWALQSTGVSFLMHKVIFANNQFVAVGVSGSILTSPDGVTWTQRFSPNSFGGSLNGVSFGAGKYVATGSSGTILTSADGGTWTQQPSGTGALLYDIAWGSSTFTVSGGSNLVLTSPNGNVWTSAGNTLNPPTAWWGRAIFGTNTFVGVGLQGAVMTSPNGHAWLLQSTGTSNQLLGIAYGNGVYVAVGSNGIILTSPEASPKITAQPVAVTSKPGKTVKFTVKATGSGKLTYQWTKNGTKLKDNSRYKNVTSATLTIEKVQKSDAGTYQVIVKNSFGSVGSTKVALKVS